MSRRKQAKPQQLRSDEEPADITSEIAAPEEGAEDADSGNESRSSSEETHVCEKCCGEFFKWSDLCEHQRACTRNPPVLIMREDEARPSSQVFPIELSPAPSCPGDLADAEETEGCPSPGEAEASTDRAEKDSGGKDDELMEVEPPADKAAHLERLEDAQGLSEAQPQLLTPPPIMSYSMPNTNVTLETLQGTRVAVAQFSQGFRAGAGAAGNTMAIPMILDQLMSLQQQQIHQLQLIEQIRSQVAVMNRQPAQLALNAVTATQGSPSAPRTSPLQGFSAPSVGSLPAMMSCTANGQDSRSLTSALDRPQLQKSQLASGKSSPRTSINTSISTNSDPVPSICSVVSSLLPPYSNKSNGCSQPLNTSNNVSLAAGSLLGSASNVPLQPQSSSSGVIFPNPLASIAATANALDPLSALVKHRKGKPPNVSIFDTKPSSEDPFFKHKCRFCAKVFGSDSALQIHLRSHTGERPFKCNICGNRFSTKGNLKVHFQRHKEKYPHIQMNPYPVPEYLDNVPTSSGIPYGMSFPPEKPVTTWLDSKPILPTVPTSLGLQLPTSRPALGSYSDSPSLTPLNISPQRPSPASSECTSLSPNPSSERGISANLHPAVQDDHALLDVKSEGIHLPSNCTTGFEKTLSPMTQVLSDTTNPNSSATIQFTDPKSPPSPISNPVISTISDQFKAKFPFGGLLDSMQTSETSKLQQLVENIDKKMTDPNQCVICHRVLSCQSALKMHYRIHTGERPFKCKVCGRAFTTKGNLKTHFGVHRAKPPLRVQHSCPICQKKFTNAVVLQQHIRMHMGGQIPNTPLFEDFQDMDTDFSFDDKEFTDMGNYDDDLMDENSLEDETEINEVNGEPQKSKISSSTTSTASSSPSVILSNAVLDKQMKATDSTVNMNYVLGVKSVENGFLDHDHLTNDTSSAVGDAETQSVGSPALSESSGSIRAFSPTLSQFEGSHSKSPGTNSAEFSQELTTVKCEKPESPSPAFENGALNLTAVQFNKPAMKQETPYNVLHSSRDHGLIHSAASMVTSTTPSTVKIEMNSHIKPISAGEGTPLPSGIPAGVPTSLSPGITSLLVPPALPRRTPKQHNCHSCGKNFSSASALQIHERTHTGEKPFGCSICGRAFTTKGNLKVHMGTHMWNNAPARRGRRLSVENPMTLLGGDAVKFSEMLQKDLAARAMNMDPSFWNQYAAAISSGLAMKNNEISVIQNGGIAPLPVSLGGGGIPPLGNLSAGLERTHSGKSSPMITLEKTNLDVRVVHPFSRFLEDNKEIKIN